MKAYPALEVRAGSIDLLLAALDDFSPTALDETDGAVRVFFATRESRDAAHRALSREFAMRAIDVPDDDWAGRSQAGLAPVTVGRITVVPDPARDSAGPPSGAGADATAAITITIRPSMGFGTGHHATTRLCLDALQQIDVRGARVLDVGTGSGVLALAADRLGATRVLGIDVDADALQSARENLPLNPEATHVTFAPGDLESARLPQADVVAANLTGALLVRAAPRLAAAVRPDGRLIVSGLQSHERAGVLRAFASCAVVRESAEDEWICLTLSPQGRAASG